MKDNISTEPRADQGNPLNQLVLVHENVRKSSARQVRSGRTLDPSGLTACLRTSSFLPKCRILTTALDAAFPLIGSRNLIGQKSRINKTWVFLTGTAESDSRPASAGFRVNQPGKAIYVKIPSTDNGNVNFREQVRC